MKRSSRLKWYCLGLMVLWLMLVAWPVSAAPKLPPDPEVAREVIKDNNKAIIEEFLKYELRQVNEYAVKPLLSKHASLDWFIKQVDRGPINSLLFLEEWVNRLRDAQKNMESFPYVTIFSADERKKLMALKPTADKIVTYGIPLIKRDFYKVVLACKELADKKRKHPMELIPDPAFRDAVYRLCEATPESLDREMWELSDGELICMRLGWVLETVTVTRLWLMVNDNTLPKENDYMAYRKKRSEYFDKRLKKIYGQNNLSQKNAEGNKGVK